MNLLLRYLERNTANGQNEYTAVGSSGFCHNAQINTYNEYGQPAATNVGRFQYTGQNRNRPSKNLDCRFKIASMRKLG